MNDACRNKSGCSAQYFGNSHNDTGDSINGGAVREDISPVNEANDLRNDVQEEDVAYCEAVITAISVELGVLSYYWDS